MQKQTISVRPARPEAITVPSSTGLVLLVALIFLMLAALVLPGVAQAADFDQEELSFLEQINEYRAANGAGKLMLSPQLSKSAARHAADMGNFGYFSHDTQQSNYYPNGYKYYQRLRADGYGGADTSGENLVAGAAGAAEVFRMWKGSADHNANMLRSYFVEVGIARAYIKGSPYGWYWVTDFGGSLDSTAYDPFQNLGGPFRDVPPDHIFADYIEALKNEGLVGGYQDGRFGINDNLLRAQFAKIITGVAGFHTQDDERPSHSCFSDVPPDGEYPHDYVEEATHRGIVKGRPDGTFGPFDRITRGQLAVMVVRAAEGRLEVPPALDPGFSDMGNLSSEFKEAIAIAKHNGILGGYADGTYRPHDHATRGQMAKMVYFLAQKI